MVGHARGLRGGDPVIAVLDNGEQFSLLIGAVDGDTEDRRRWARDDQFVELERAVRLGLHRDRPRPIDLGDVDAGSDVDPVLVDDTLPEVLEAEVELLGPSDREPAAHRHDEQEVARAHVLEHIGHRHLVEVAVAEDLDRHGEQAPQRRHLVVVEPLPEALVQLGHRADTVETRRRGEVAVLDRLQHVPHDRHHERKRVHPANTDRISEFHVPVATSNARRSGAG